VQEEELLDKIQTTSSSFEKREMEHRAALSQVYSLQTKKRKIEKEIERLEEKTGKLTSEIKQSMKHLEDLQNKMRDLKTLISMRLRVSGQIVDSSLKDIVLLAKNPSEIERLLKGLSHLLQKDVVLVRELQAKKQEFTKAQEQTKLKIKDLTANKQEHEKKRASLDHLKHQKDVYIAKIQKDKKRYLNILTELRKKGEDTLILSTDERVTSIIRKSFFEMKKQLEPPTKGIIVQDYGAFDRLPSVKLFSKGIYFEVGEPKDVTSVAHGKVVFVGDVKDYKNTIVLDHGNHYYTVYSFLRDVIVKVGQEVDKNQLLGKTGYNPYMSVNGIYFEIRHFSDALNPTEWFNGSYKSLSKIKSSKGDTL
jgi:septal ring factor EnvC (AmiA/AmiB activator)